MSTQAPTIKQHSPYYQALERGIIRAAAEGIVVYRKSEHTLGVASVKGGKWVEKPYTITITGKDCRDAVCSCPSGERMQCCKHYASAVFARKHGTFAIAPAMA